MGLLIRDISLGKNMSKNVQSFSQFHPPRVFYRRWMNCPITSEKKKTTVLSVPDFPQVRIGHET